MSMSELVAGYGYDLTPAPLQTLSFHSATRVGDLVYTSGQVPSLGDLAIRGKVGADVDLATAQKAAEICAVKCLCAAAAVAAPEEFDRVVKVFGMVNTGPDFTDTSAVINGATDFFNAVFPGRPSHARSAVGMTLPGNWAVEVEIVLALKPAR